MTATLLPLLPSTIATSPTEAVIAGAAGGGVVVGAGMFFSAGSSLRIRKASYAEVPLCPTSPKAPSTSAAL